MYPSIANTTFSYLLTIGKFRDAIPEIHRPSWVKITTITMVSKFLKEIDVHTLRARLQALGSLKIRMKGTKSEGFEWKVRETKFYNQITIGYVDNYSTKSVKVFPNGSVQVAGCSDLFDCNRVIKQLGFILKTVLQLDHEIPSDSFKVVMINTNFSLNYNINLFALSDHFSKESIFNVSFDPDRYSAVKIKFKPAEDMKQVTASVFSTGKIIVTGAENLKEIAYAYNILNQHILSQARSIKVNKTDTVDKFDSTLGYKLDNFINDLPKLGFKPWAYTSTNYQINF